MKTLRLSILAVCAYAALFYMNAAAQDTADKSAVQRVCQPEDLIGHTYKMVDFKETPPQGETVWLEHFRYSYLAFGPENKFYSISTNREVKDPKRLEQILQWPPGRTKIYSLDKTGVLNLFLNDKPRYSYRCIAILKPVGQYIKGDLVLTGYTRKAKSELYKLYRRWY